MQTKNNQQHVIIRARCTRQFIVYLVTWTFQSIQSYLYRETSVRESDCPENVRYPLLMGWNGSAKAAPVPNKRHSPPIKCTKFVIRHDTIVIFAAKG